MAKHDPTKQHKEMYHELNVGGTGHSVPKKDLNAMGGSGVEQNPFHEGMGTVVKDSYKSHHGNLEAKPMSSSTFGQSEFSDKQIPNTGPKFREEDSLAVTKRKVQHKSKSLIFHG